MAVAGCRRAGKIGSGDLISIQSDQGIADQILDNQEGRRVYLSPTMGPVPMEKYQGSPYTMNTQFERKRSSLD